VNGFTEEKCDICGCKLYRGGGTYAKPTTKGLSHATKHHYIPERFFGRSKNRNKKNTERIPIFIDKKNENGAKEPCPWSQFEEDTLNLCYECHEELIHNPVFLNDDINNLRKLVYRKGLNEDDDFEKRDRSKIAGRIVLLHEVISRGIDSLIKEHK